MDLNGLNDQRVAEEELELSFENISAPIIDCPLINCIDEFQPAFTVIDPQNLSLPIVLSSPHSGRHYPDAFVEASQLSPVSLRRSEDSFVDELFSGGPLIGAPLLAAEFPRAFCDVNREAYELDPRMFRDTLPDYANTRSIRVASGLGTIARVVADGAEIYKSKLQFADATQRIERLYRPYHNSLEGLLDRALLHFETAVLIDCHSMPSRPAGANSFPLPDFVLGDRFGTSCNPALVRTAEKVLKSLGYSVSRNDPYAGGYSTQHYGRPNRGIHALQIEINRALYMDEATVDRSIRFDRLKADLQNLLEALAALDFQQMKSPFTR